jgi:drug/metabolite transporter (DMT)-like permease
MITPQIVCTVLLAAVIHAYWNYIVKTIPGGASFVWIGALAVSAWMLPAVAIWLYFFPVVWTSTLILCLFVSGLLHMVYFLVLQQGYQKADLSVVYPLARGSGPIFSSLAAIALLGETMTSLAFCGLCLVAVGIILIARPRGQVLDKSRLQLGIGYGLLTGFLIAGYTIWDGYLVREMLVAPLVLEAFSHPLRVLILMPYALRHKTEISDIWQNYRTKLFLFAVLSPIAFLMILYALKHAPVHFVAPTRELSIVIGVVLAGKLLAEEDNHMRVFGSVFMVIGVVLLATG